MPDSVKSLRDIKSDDITFPKVPKGPVTPSVYGASAERNGQKRAKKGLYAPSRGNTAITLC